MRGSRGLYVVVAALAALLVGADAAAAARPVPSLEPAKTAKEWRRLVAQPPMRALSTAECLPARVVFYAPTDWLRLATKLAATPAACTDYYVTVPPLAADKTQFRGDQAWRIDALGASFHAVAEVNMTGWGGWVSANASTWYAAGVEARRRLAAAGYGDRWALNELSTAVRRGDGTARADAREFLRGLYDGPGEPAKGIVFVTGMSQATTNLSIYQQNLQGWLLDTPFWEDMARYVRDWSQEQYGDARNILVPGAPLEARVDSLVDYLDHQLVLGRVGPAEAAAARAFLETASSPVANAAWQWVSGFGWTDVDVDSMKHVVSTQVYALRHFRSGTSGGSFGFAWSPRNASGATEFTAQSGDVLVRLAAAIADSAVDPLAACGVTWCAGEIAGGWLNEGWQTFRSWYVPPPDTVAPETTLTAAPAGVVASGSATISFTSEPGATFECALDGAAYAACTSPVFYAELADGAHTVSVRAIDTAGNVDASPALATWSVDGSAPETFFTAVPPSSTRSRSAGFSFAATEPGTFECSLNWAAWSACTSPTGFSYMPKGYHTFRVRSRDVAGNVDASPASTTWRVY